MSHETRVSSTTAPTIRRRKDRTEKERELNKTLHRQRWAMLTKVTRPYPFMSGCKYKEFTVLMSVYSYYNLDNQPLHDHYNVLKRNKRHMSPSLRYIYNNYNTLKHPTYLQMLWHMRKEFPDNRVYSSEYDKLVSMTGMTEEFVTQQVTPDIAMFNDMHEFDVFHVYGLQY